MSIKETCSMICPCISSHVLQKQGGKENQRLNALSTMAALLVPVECIYIQVTASQLSLWSCILSPRGEHSLPAVLLNPSAPPSRSIPSQSFYTLTVWISLTPQVCPEPLASQEPNSLTNSSQSSTDLSQSYTNVPLCHPPRQPNTRISHEAPFPSPALPPQINRLSFLHTLA